jgi:hypothetical protein
VERITTHHAAEGTAAHELAERALTTDLPAAAWLGQEINGYIVGDEMADAVQVYVDHCRDVAGLCQETWVEQSIDLRGLNPPSNMWGTADHVGVSYATNGARRLYVSDLKYGKGVEVDAEGNTQLLYYGLGAYLVSPYRKEISEVVLTIVQPRVGQPVKSVTYSVQALIDFAHELLNAADAALQEDAPRSPGDHCRWCPGAAICPEKHDEMQALAQIEFAAPVAPPAPAELSLVQLQVVLHRKKELTAWLKAVEDYTRAKIASGELQLPGFKLVETRPQRKWKLSAAETDNALRRRGVLVRDMYAPRELRSPAQVEKHSGRDVPEDLVVRVSSGLTLAPESDPRPAVVLDAASEFAALPAYEDE